MKVKEKPQKRPTNQIIVKMSVEESDKLLEEITSISIKLNITVLKDEYPILSELFDRLPA